MDIREIGNRAGRVRGSVVRRVSAAVNKPLIAKLISYALRFGIGFLLPRGIVLGSWSPFGPAFAAALGASDGALVGIIGTMLGYFYVLGNANGLKYIAICILIYTASFVFRGTSLMGKSWFMPLSAAVCTAAIGFVFVAQMGFPAVETAFFITEITLVTVCTYAYQFYFNPSVAGSGSGSGTIFCAASLIVLVASLLIPLNNVELIAQASLGRILAVLFIMVSGYHGGIGAGSAAGVIVGLSISIASGEAAYCAIYGFAGVTSALFARKGKLLFVVVYLISNAGAMFWTTAGTEIAVLYEAFFASATFLLVGELLADAIPSLESAVRRDSSKRVRDFTRDRLIRASRAFGELGDMLSTSLHSIRENENNIAAVFNHPASRVCRRCELSGACWEKEYISTRDALNSVTGAMKEHGRLEASDLPLHFTSRCVHLKEFLNEVNRELIAHQYRRQFRSRIAESRKVICKQYRGMAQIFDKMSRDVSAQPKFDLRGEEGVRRALRDMGVNAGVCVYRDGANHVRLQIEGRDLSRIFKQPKECLELFSDVLGVPLSEPEKEEGDRTSRFLARQAEPLCASMGVAVHKKHSSEMSGDSGSYFKLEDGRLCVILSDGMGSGKEAAMESSSAIRMLERFLKSGIDPELSLSTINSALVIKNTELGGFATLDFMCVNLFTGECEFYKYGSAPSYIKRGRHIRRITSSALPAGVGGYSETTAEKTRLKLHAGDMVVMASDGIADASDDMWLQELLSEYAEDSARELASSIMNRAFGKYGRADDMTVMTVKISKNQL